MTSPFDTAGFTNPAFSTQANAVAVQNQPVSAPATNTVAVEPKKLEKSPETDEFTNQTQIDKDAIKAELKEEIQKEIQQEEAKKNKLGPIGKFKRFIGTTKKAFATMGEYAKGTFKGIVTGAVLGSVGFTALTLMKKPTGAKVVGVLGAVAGLGIQLWRASLRANESRAAIDHTWEKTPVSRK